MIKKFIGTHIPNLLPLVIAGFSRYRKKRKNLTVVLSLVFFLMFLFINVFSVLNNNLKTYWVESYNSGDLALPSAESHSDLMTPVNPDNYFNAEDFWKNNEAFQSSATPRLRFGSLIGPQAGDGELEQGLVVIGIDPGLEKKILSGLKIREGQYFSGKEDEIILPQSIAGSIGVKLGEEIVLAVMTPTGYYNMEKATLVGIQDVPATAFIFGTYMGYIPLPLAQRLLDTSKISEMALKPDRGGFYTPVQGPFTHSPALSNLSISRAISLAYMFLQLIIVLFLGIFSIGIVYQNIVLMNEDRVSEIGIYLSYGASPLWIQTLMYFELILYTTYCAVIGGLIGIVVMGSLTTAGLSPVDMVTDVMMGAKALNLWPSPQTWLVTWALLLACVVGAAAVPVLRATQSSAIVKLFRK